MPKESNRDIKNKIKKMVPQNEWLINVTKSLGFANLEVIKELMPNTASTVSWNKNVVTSSDLIQNIRSNNGVRNMFNKQMGNLPHVKMAQEMKSNALADLKSGNFYNSNREMGLDDNGEFDFSFDMGGDFEFIDDDGGGSSSEDTSDESQSNSRPPITVINTMPLAKTIASGTEATVNTMAAISDQNMAVETEKIMMTRHNFNATMNALSSINENLALLVQFNSDSTAKYQAAALKYFEESLSVAKEPEEEEQRKRLLNPFTAEGGIKLDEIAEVIKENLADIKDSNVALSGIYDMFKNPELLSGFVKNPLGFLMTEGIKKAIPNVLKSSLSGIDKNLNAVLPALLARINTFEGSNDPLLNYLNKVFGYKHKLSYDVDLGEYEKGAVSWDGESKKALVEVIPAYLRRIESVLSGGDERVYNYSTGKFEDFESIRKNYDKKLAEVETSGFTGVRSEIRDVVSKLDLSTEATDQLFKDFEQYFRAMTKKGHLIRHRDRTNDFGIKINEMTQEGLFDFDPNRTKLVQKILDLLPPHILSEMGTVAITDSRERTERHMDEIRLNPNLSGHAVLNHDTDEEGRQRYKNIKSLFDQQKDRFGLSSLDYLRDIRSALIHGIKVFPDYYFGSGGEPNGPILTRERAENEAYEEKMREEEEIRNEQERIENQYNRSGRSIYDAAKMKDEEWEALFPQIQETVDNKVANNINSLNNNVESLVMQILYGEDNYKNLAIEKLKKMYAKGKPMVESMRGFFSDTVKAFKSFFTGQGYITSDGVEVSGSDSSILGSIKKSLFGIKDKFKGATKEGGILNNFFSDFADGLNEFKVSLFGEKKLSDGKETFQDLMVKVKQRMPKAIGGGIAGAMTKTFFASQLGVLGNFLLPGGPLGAALTGTAIGFLTQSETFNRYMFGEQDENGERVGGIISKAWQDKYQEYKGAIGKGAGIGLLGSLILPGGPIAGAIMGIGASIASKNEAFQELLYGKDFKDKDKKSLMNGAFGKTFKRLMGGAGSDGDIDPKLAKFLGTTGLAVGVAQGVGLLPSFLLPGGPVLGAILGLAGGITASSNKFQELLLGEKDVDGKRYGGLLTKVSNWFNLTFAQPLKIKMTEINDKIYGMLRKKIFDPLARSIEPVLHAFKNVAIDIKNGIVDAFTKVTSPIVSAFKENIIDPVANVLKKTILNPIKWILKKTFGLLGKGIVGILTSPLKLISGIGHAADMYNTRAEIRHEKRNRGKEYDKAHKDDGTWNKKDRKKAQKMSKDEKKALLDEKLKYRDGKTWRQRKKEQKGEYKDEMSRRQERLQQMKDQFEEDKKFAKASGWKFSSKKQKERREQELKEKERWIQEQQLIQAQDTDEKVSKIADNVIEFPKRNDVVVSKMDDIKNTVKEGLDKIADRFKKPGADHDTSGYGEVTDEHMAKIYDFLDEKQKRRPHKTEPEDYGVVTDQDIDNIHNYIAKEDEKDNAQPPATLKDAFDGFVSEVKDLVDTVKENKRNKSKKDDEGPDDDPKEKRIKKWKRDGKPSNIIDINKFLQDNDQSHADGLDLVPNDGYIAELHEGEMVVPEKPAGKLRGLMNKAGKGFKGLTDVLSDVSEDDSREDEENGPVENALLQGTIKGLRGIAKGFRGMAGMMGKLAGGMSEEERQDREDNAMQLTDMEADRLKEMEDKARYEHASRKDADFVRAQTAAKEKEKEEKKWKENLLNAVKGVGHAATAAGLNLFDLLGKGLSSIMDGFGNLGSVLSSLALPAAVAALSKLGDDYQESEEYIQGHTDADGSLVTDNYDLVKHRTWASARKQLIFKPLKTIKKKIIDPLVDVGSGVKKGVKKAYNSKLSKKFIQPIVNKTGNKLKNVKEFVFGRGSKKTTTEATSNVIDFAAAKAAKESTGSVAKVADTKIAKQAAETASNKKLAKMIGSVADDGGLVGKVVAIGKQALQKIGEYAVEKFPKISGLAKKLVGCAEPIFSKLLKFSDDILKFFGKKIPKVLTKIGAGVATGFTLDAVFAVGDLVSGATAGNAGNLFGVSPENVDGRMRIISSVIQTVFNFNFMAIISLINEITNMMFNFNFLRNIAIWLYNLTGGKQDFSSRITPAEIDSCKSIEEALQIMGITDPNDIAMLKDGDDWKDFSKVENKDLGGVITAAEQIELARLQYNLENGTTLNSQAFIDKTSETLGTKFMKLFKTEKAETKYNKLTKKSTDRKAKADEYREKAKDSKNIFSKGWNNSMAWVNDKLSARAEKKAEKTKTKAAKKKTKAEEKLSYHQSKAESSTGIAKWYHNWRANANKKKIDKYTMSDGKVEPENVGLEGQDLGEQTFEEVYGFEKKIMTPEEFKKQYPDTEPGMTYTDASGNAYDSEGNYLGDAGMGDGEPEDQVITPVQYTEQESNKKKSGSGLVSKVMKTFLKATPGTAGLASIFGKNKKAKDYELVAIKNEEGKTVSYQFRTKKELTATEGFTKDVVKQNKQLQNSESMPQYDDNGKVIGLVSVAKNKAKGFLGKLASGVGSIFGLGSSTAGSSSVDNSVTTTTSGDTYNTTTNEIDTSPFGPLTDAINALVSSQGGDNVDEEGNVKTGGILSAILDPMGYLTKKLTNIGIDVYESTTGNEVDQEKLNKGMEIFNMLRNPLGYLYSKTKEYVNNEENKDKSWKEIGKNAIEDGKENLKNAWNTTKDWTTDKTNKVKEWGKDKWNNVKEKGQEWIDEKVHRSQETAAIMAGNKDAKANVFSTAISGTGAISAGIYNLFASEENELTSGEMTDAIATFINKAMVTPFKELTNPATDKFNEVKESISDWVTEKKENITNWYTEEFKPGLEKSKESAKKTQQAIIDDVNATKERISNWYTENIGDPLNESKKRAKETQQAIFDDVKARKEKLMGWYKTNIGDPLTESKKRAKETQQAIFDDVKNTKDKIIGWFNDNIKKPFEDTKNKIKESVSSWVTGFKEKIVNAFNTYIKDPVSEALSPVITAVSGAWSSFKSAFSPFVEFFDYITGKSDKSLTQIIKDYGKEGRENAGLEEETPRSGPKPSEYLTANKIKPVQHNISSNELLKPINTTNNNTTTTNRTNNKFVFYNQSDARWGNDRIGNKFMKDAGCGPTSLAMAVSQMTGEQITPDTIAKLGQEHLPGYSQYSLFPSIADKLDMNYTEGKDPNFIIRNLKQGIPVVLSGRTNSSGSPFTSEGHVVTASHIKGNMVYIQDPRGEQYSRYYPLNSLMVGLTKGMILTPSRQTDVSRLSSSGVPTGLELDPTLSKQGLGIYGDVGEYQGLNDTDKNMGRTGASQITIADRVLSYARAFLNNTSKFSYSQPRRLQIDTNKSSSKGCGADCSSFVSHVLSRAGDVDIYGNTSTTFWNNLGTKVSEPQIGDVVCQVGHVGLYSGNGNYIHMSGRKAGIKESKAIQNGNNKHRGYKRVLKNPAQMVDPTVPNPNSFLGTVVGTSSGNPVGGGATSGTTDGTTTTTAVPAIDELGVFGKLKNIGTGMIASIYNGKDVFDSIMNPSAGTSADGTTSTDGTNPDISGISDTATAVWKFFTGKGYSAHATAGIMGNLKQESGLDPTRFQSGGGKGRGIAQWTVGSDRFKGLESHAKSKGKDWKDLQSQLEWIDLELNGKDSTTASKLKKNYGGLEKFKQATDYKWAVEAFEKSFERAGTPNYPRRHQYAQEFYDKLSNAGTGPAMATSAQAAPTDGSIPDVMNGWKFYQQSDPKWKGDVGGSSVSAGGCGPTSHAMMLTTIFGKEITPLTMTRWGRKNGTWTGAMQWSMPGKVASSFGLNMTDLGSNANGAPASTLDKVKESLKAGKPVILTGRGTGPKGSAARTDTPFTPGGHVVLAVGLDGNGNVIINDPRGANRTKAYTDDGIMNVGVGLRGAWAFDTSGGSIPSEIETGGDFTGGGTASGTTDGGTTTSIPAIDELGVFGKLKSIGTGLIASIFNGKDVFDAIMNPSAGTTDGTTSGGSLPVGDTTVDETLMLSGQEGFFKALGPSAAAAFNQYHIFPSTTLAQAALESAWGKSRVAKSDKNLFGIKWTGKYAPGITVTQGLNCPGNEQGGARPYNRYQSYADSMTDHGWFLDKYDRYNAALAANTPEEQIRLLGKSGYAEASTYGSSLQKMVDKYNLTQYNSANTSTDSNAGMGDGKTYMVQPKGDAGMGDGKASYNRTRSTGVNTTDIEAKRKLENINRKVNVAVNNINASDPNAYAEVLKLIMQELRDINNNTAATASGIHNIEIVSANTPIDDDRQTTTADLYRAGKKQKSVSKLQTINSSTGYATARQIAGYKK